MAEARVTGTDWSRFSVERISAATFLKRTLIHADLLASILARAPRSVLEVGVGSGAQIAALSRLVTTTVTVDNDPRIMSAARPNLDRFGTGVRLLAADAFALPFRRSSFDVAVSQGLMEHFGDESIAALVREQLRVARAVVFSVPSDRYPRQDVGDERLMSPGQWSAIMAAGLGLGLERYRVRARYYRFDPESLKYSLLARRRLGGFSVLVTVDRG